MKLFFIEYSYSTDLFCSFMIFHHLKILGLILDFLSKSTVIREFFILYFSCVECLFFYVSIYICKILKHDIFIVKMFVKYMKASLVLLYRWFLHYIRNFLSHRYFRVKRLIKYLLVYDENMWHNKINVHCIVIILFYQANKL